METERRRAGGHQGLGDGVRRSCLKGAESRMCKMKKDLQVGSLSV